MTSFRLSVSPHRRAAARFVKHVHRCLQKAYAQSPDITQTEIASALGVHRSVINRQLRGQKDISLSRVAELAWAMGYEPDFNLVKPDIPDGCNDIPGTRNLNPFTQVEQSSTANIHGSISHSSIPMVNEDA